MKPNALLDGQEIPGDRKYGYIDRGGRLVIAGEFDMAGEFSAGLAQVLIGSLIGRCRIGYIDQNGTSVIPANLISATDFVEGLALVQRRGKRNRESHEVIDRAGKTLLKLPYQTMKPFSEGLAAVWSDDELYGFVDMDGKWRIEPQFENCGSFHNGLALVRHQDWFGLIDAEGRFVWGPRNEGSWVEEMRSNWLE